MPYSHLIPIRVIIHASLLIAPLTAISTPQDKTDEKEPEAHLGKADYQLNCAACHLLDTTSVGPSLVTIASTYPADQQETFVQWVKAPGKKNPEMIQMPPMAHVPEAKLALIHDYILEATVGVKEKGKGHGFPRFEEPERKLPYAVRAFLPDTSPASIGIILEGKISVCWDTEACRLRYAWSDDNTRLGDFSNHAKLPSPPYYRETSERLWLFASDKETKPKYLGYRLGKNGAPEFNYQIGPVEVREKIDNGKAAGTFVREFTIKGASGVVHLDLQSEGGAITSSRGTINDGVLSVDTTDSQKFTLTVSRP